jgi:RNA polymerase sigma factor (sigma-70 family)
VQALNEITDMRPDGTDTLKTRPTLLSKVRRGDEDGWSHFYELYEGFIYSAARGAGLSPSETQDVVQETMITVRNYISDFIPDERRAKFRTWLRKIVGSRIADQYRKKKRNPLEKAARREPPPTEESATSTTNRIPDLNGIELDRLIDGKLEQAILEEARKLAKEKVRMEDYQAYDLFTIHEMRARDVAVSLGINAVTVRVRAFRVRRAVEQEMRRIGRMLEEPKRAN